LERIHVVHSGMSPCMTWVSARGAVSVPAEAARRNDRLKVAEIKFADRLQRLGGRAVLKILRQTFQPVHELELFFHEAGDMVGPAPRPAAVIRRSAVADDRHTGPRAQRDSGPGVRRRSWRFHRLVCVVWFMLRSVTSRYGEPATTAQLRFLTRQLSLPVSMISQ
jgi:hypothetical protein